MAAAARSVALGSRFAVTRAPMATSAAASAPATAAALPPPGAGAPLASASRKAPRGCDSTSCFAGGPAPRAPASLSRARVSGSVELVVPDVGGAEPRLDQEHPQRRVDHDGRTGRVGADVVE